MNSKLILFASRNVRIFFRDRASVVFSMFAALIVIALYYLFLGDMIAGGYEETMPDARIIVDSWAMAGVMAVVPVTTTLGAMGVMVVDRIGGTIRDLTISPMKTYEIVGGYVLSAFAVGTVLSLLALAFAEIYIVSNGGTLLSAVQFVKVIGLMLLSVFSASAVMFFITIFVTSTNVQSTINSLVGTLIGFLTGVFIPIGMLPAAMGTVVKIVPASHSASLFRQIMMEGPMGSMAALPPEEVLEFELDMGVRFGSDGSLLAPEMSLLILAATGAAFFILAILKLSAKPRL